jgi:hypothetical protein
LSPCSVKASVSIAVAFAAATETRIEEVIALARSLLLHQH